MKITVPKRTGLAAVTACAAVVGLAGQSVAGDSTWTTSAVSFNHTNWFERAGSPGLIDSVGMVQLYRAGDAVMSRNHIVHDPFLQCQAADSTDPWNDSWWWTATDFQFTIERFSGQQASNSGIEVLVYDANLNKYFNMGVFGYLPQNTAAAEDIKLTQFGTDDIAIEFKYAWGSGDVYGISAPQITSPSPYSDYFSSVWGVQGPQTNCTQPPPPFYGGSLAFRIPPIHAAWETPPSG